MAENSVEPQDRSTHATRHPEKDVIPPRKEYTKTSRAERETANVRRKLKHERDEEIKQEVDIFLEQRESFALQMATKFSIKVEKARDLLNSAYVVKRQRKPSAFNAIVSHRAKELNDGLSKGDRMPLEKIREIVMEEMEEGKYDAEEIEAMIDELVEQRELKTKGARCSNRAAAVNHHATLRHLESEVFLQDQSSCTTAANMDLQMGNLHERVGTVGFAFFSRGHINDSIIPGWIESQGALEFVKDVLETTPEELANKFELWACTKNHKKKVETIGQVRVECVNLVSRGLRGSSCTARGNDKAERCIDEITGRSNITMRYENYEVDVVLKYGVVLKGWPSRIKFQSPAKITRLEDACILRDALLSGQCHWAKISNKKKKEREKERRDKLANGEIAPKQRKRRSDAGVKRGPRNGGKGAGKRKRGDESMSESDDERDEENTANTKKRRTHFRQPLKCPPKR
ncbi:hypothetical protein H0H92_001477 [Tricholoma furcatifolium]|nr:hypothetical protein H0H92_001477 [Tricholoma furcatifolium]